MNESVPSLHSLHSTPLTPPPSLHSPHSTPLIPKLPHHSPLTPKPQNPKNPKPQKPKTQKPQNPKNPKKQNPKTPKTQKPKTKNVGDLGQVHPTARSSYLCHPEINRKGSPLCPKVIPFHAARTVLAKQTVGNPATRPEQALSEQKARVEWSPRLSKLRVQRSASNGAGLFRQSAPPATPPRPGSPHSKKHILILPSECVSLSERVRGIIFPSSWWRWKCGNRRRRFPGSVPRPGRA